MRDVYKRIDQNYTSTINQNLSFNRTSREGAHINISSRIGGSMHDK